MGKVKVIEVNLSAFALQQKLAEEVRAMNRKNGTLMINVMASPGAGKTSVLLRTADALRGSFRMGVMEADIDATVDAEKMDAAGLPVIQVHTDGQCAMTAEMTKQALEAFPTQDIDVLFLENVGNLVCPAEEDTGADISLAILSVPEGDDKPLKYPLMFEVCDVVLINKIDTKGYFRFDDDAVQERIRMRNPKAEIFFLSAKTGEGFDAWTGWLKARLSAR